VIPEPDFKECAREEVDFILMACDGVWDVRSSIDAIAEVHSLVYDKEFEAGRGTEQEFKEKFQTLINNCCAPEMIKGENRGYDNISGCLIEFKKNE
jgi:serine/threonine protein phosphatase PrpC